MTSIVTYCIKLLLNNIGKYKIITIYINSVTVIYNGTWHCFCDALLIEHILINRSKLIYTKKKLHIMIIWNLWFKNVQVYALLYTNAMNTRNILKYILHCYTFCKFVMDALQKYKILKKNAFSLVNITTLPCTLFTTYN